MKIDILTIFPQMFEPVLGASIIGRAREKGILEINTVDFREYTKNKHNRVDDTPFGGGQGMVIMPQPVFDALRGIDAKGKRILYMSPRGKVIDKEYLSGLSREEEIVIMCGHYEGIDQRIIDEWDMEEVSIGDYVLTGGELPAMVLIDALARMIPGVLSGEASAFEESIYSGLLEYPQYSQPREFEGIGVPEVLLSGNHKAIDLWKYEQSLRLTKDRRPDLFDAYVERIRRLEAEERSRGVRKPKVLSKEEKKIFEELTAR